MTGAPRSTAPALQAFLVADLLLRGNAQQGFVLDDGSVLILDERMPQGFIATATAAGNILVGRIGGDDNQGLP